MKNKIFLTLALMFALFVLPLASADILPQEGYHYVNYCSKIINVNEFKDVYFVAEDLSVGGGHVKNYLINNDVCLEDYMSYKFNEIKVYAIEKNYFNSVDIENIDFSNENVYSLEYLSKNEGVYLGGEVEDDNNSLYSQTFEYTILGFAGREVISYQSKVINKSKKGNILGEEIFENPGYEGGEIKKIIDIKEEPSPTPEPKKEPDSIKPQELQIKTFWEKIICFFKKSC